MDVTQFEWDKHKAADNFRKHGVSFDMACGVFNDPFALERYDDRDDYGEDRFIIIGMTADRILYVAYTVRNERVRIISARGAEPYEQRQYHEGTI
jgi:uncharacterized DUF497 family protein